MNKNSRIQSLMCRASEGVYKKHLEFRYGIKACRGKLSDMELEDLMEDIELLKYLNCTKNPIIEKCCNFDRLIETLT